MGKKSKSKKKNAGRKQPPPTAAASASSINKGDDIDAVLNWIPESYFADVKGFGLKLPNTSQDLFDGKVSPKQVVIDLQSAFHEYMFRTNGVKEYVAKFCAGMAFPDKDDDEEPKTEDDILFDAHLKERDDIGIVGMSLFKNDKDKEQFYRKTFQAGFADDLLTQFNTQAVVNRFELHYYVKNIVDNECIKWSRELDDHRGGPGGGKLFLKQCKLWGMSAESYFDVNMPCFAIPYYHKVVLNPDIDPDSLEGDSSIFFDAAQLLEVTRAVAAGCLKSEKEQCWECNKYCPPKQKCAGCGVAAYCSRDCQVSFDS